MGAIADPLPLCPEPALQMTPCVSLPPAPLFIRDPARLLSHDFDCYVPHVCSRRVRKAPPLYRRVQPHQMLARASGSLNSTGVVLMALPRDRRSRHRYSAMIDTVTTPVYVPAASDRPCRSAVTYSHMFRRPRGMFLRSQSR